MKTCLVGSGRVMFENPCKLVQARFAFCVKSGLVIEMFVWVYQKDGLGSSIMWPIFIYFPSPLGST